MPEQQITAFHRDTHYDLPTSGEYSGYLGKYTQLHLTDTGSKHHEQHAVSARKRLWRIQESPRQASKRVQE
jgi:hypothetical protein